MAMNKLIVSRTRDATVDPEKLGRWSSILVEGAQGYNTRFVSAYVPCANNTGPHTVYTQHKDHFRRQGSDREPIQAMIEDFGIAVASWCQEGENIVIGADANSNVRTGPFAKMLQSHGFEEQITCRHGRLEPPPATHE